MKAACGSGWVWIFGAFFCVGTAAAQPASKGGSPINRSAPSQADADAAAQARTLFQKGRQAAATGNWQAAYVTLRAAYAWLPHWQIAGGLGDAAFVLGKYPEAIDMLSQNLREATNLTAQERADAEKRLAEAKRKCGSLTIDAPDGVEVRIDGAVVGKLPLQKDLYVLPGAHTVEVVSAAGAVKKTVDVAAGETARVPTQSVVQPVSTGAPAVTEAPATGVGVGAPSGTGAPSPGAKPTGATTAQPPVGETKPSLAPAVLGVTAGVGAVVGGLLIGVSVAKKNEAVEKLKAVSNEPRPCKTDPCMKIHGLLAERDALGSAALGVWIGSAALLAVAVGVYFVQRPNKTNTAIRWAPVVSTNGGGLVVLGAF
jgi:hypothetical protein